VTTTKFLFSHLTIWPGYGLVAATCGDVGDQATRDSVLGSNLLLFKTTLDVGLNLGRTSGRW